MHDPRRRSLSRLKSRRRAARTTLAVAAAGLGHLAGLVVLSLYAPSPATRSQARPVPVAFVTPFLTPRPSRPPQPVRKPARTAPDQAARGPAIASPPPAPEAPPAAGSVAAATPAPPGYGRWAMAPGGAPSEASTGLAGCTPQALPTLSGPARDACARRLSEMAADGRAFPLIADPRKAKDLQAQAAYGDAVRAWRSADGMGPHPCPPQDVRAHRLYLDACSLVNAARRGDDPPGRRQSTGVKLEFKYRF